MKQNITKLQLAQKPNLAPLHPPNQPALETKSLTELYETGFVSGQPIGRCLFLKQAFHF